MTTARNMDKADGKAEEVPDGAVTMMSQAKYNEKIENHQELIQAKSAELTQLTKKLKDVRESKEPLTHVKNTLQEDINAANKAINTISEEVTHLKQKLRYHSVKQIHGNIERLEYQLRNNNYKPREEQKILDEISMLQRSIKTLQQYEAKQAVNKKYRAERARMIDERNNNFSRIRTLYAQEDEIKKEISAVRGIISSSKKAVDQLRQMRPKLEQGWIAHQQKLQAARVKRYEEKKRVRQEQTRERQEERRKLWEEFEASKEPYEEEKNLCQVLISYLQSSLGGTTSSAPGSSTAKFLSPSTPSQKPASTISTPGSSITQISPCSTPSQTPLTPQSTSESFDTPSASAKTKNMLPPDSSGSYYSKPRDDEEGFTKVGKRGKAKAKRERRLANRVKEIPHTPDVLIKFSKLSLLPPKTTEEVSAAIISLQDCLQKFHTLALSEKNQIQQEEKSEDTRKDASKCLRPTSLSVKSNPSLSETTEQNGLLTCSGSSSSAVQERSSPVPSPVEMQNMTCSSAIPVVSVVSLGVSWAAPVASELYTRSNMEVNPSLAGPTKQTTVFTPMTCSTTAELEKSSAAPPSLDNQPLLRPCTGPVTSVVSPVISWATAVTPEHFSNCDISGNLNQVTENTQQNQLLYNGVHPSISQRMSLNHITHEISAAPDIPSDMKLCNDIISPGNNESFFSMPVSYPSNLIELNNNAGCSYAAVVAKIKPGAVDF